MLNLKKHIKIVILITNLIELCDFRMLSSRKWLLRRMVCYANPYAEHDPHFDVYDFRINFSYKNVLINFPHKVIR